MDADHKIDGTVGKQVVSRFDGYGFWGGLALGLLVGVLMSGPHFHDWPIGTTLLVIAGCVAVGALLGFCASSIAAGSAAGGFGAGGGFFGSSQDSGHGSGGYTGGDCGGGSDGGGCGDS